MQYGHLRSVHYQSMVYHIKALFKYVPFITSKFKSFARPHWIPSRSISSISLLPCTFEILIWEMTLSPLPNLTLWYFNLEIVHCNWLTNWKDITYRWSIIEHLKHEKFTPRRSSEACNWLMWITDWYFNASIPHPERDRHIDRQSSPINRLIDVC